MPLSMKIQPIDVTDDSPPVVAVKPPPVVKSRLRRLFRISAAEPPVGELFEPSSVCLAKMVQNFIEENNEKQSLVTWCGRNRCNCFNGNGSDGSDVESDIISPSDVCDFLKSLVMCASINERNVLADTAKIVGEKNKTCKRKNEMRKVVFEGLVSMGYDAAICKSKWDKSSFPAGEYEYVDVIIGEERLIIDIDFRSEFEVARSTKTYKSILQTLPQIFVGKSDRLSKIICILSEGAKQSLRKKGMHIPPWRKTEYVQSKWLSPPTRLTSSIAATNTIIVTPPPSPITPVGSTLVFKIEKPSPDKVVDESSDVGQSSPRFESVFEMSESSGDEDVKGKSKDEKGYSWNEIISPKKKPSVSGVKTINGLASIIEDKP